VPGGEAADSGTLLSFVGGSAEIVARLTPVLRAYSSDVVHTGGVGTAQVAKAVNNLICGRAWSPTTRGSPWRGATARTSRRCAARSFYRAAPTAAGEVGHADDGLGRRRYAIVAEMAADAASRCRRRR